MWTETVLVKPKVDSASAKAMEVTLATRFTRVAKRFGSGLKNAIKGSVLGVSLGLLSKLLNPIEDLDTKLKSLLDRSTDLKDMAERFGTSGGELKQLEDVGKSFGVDPQQLKEMLLKYADAVEKAREEIKNPTQERSISTQILGEELINQADMVESFKKFMTMLRQTGQGHGIDQPLTANASRIFAQASAEKREVTRDERNKLIASGELGHRGGKDAQQFFEKEVLGAAQYGGGRKLIQSDFNKRAKDIGEGDVKQVNAAVNKFANLDAQKAFLQTANEAKDFLNASKNVNEGIIKAMEASRAREEEETTDRLRSYESISETAKTLGTMSKMLSDVSNTIVTGLGYLSNLAGGIDEIRKSSIWRTIFKGGK